MPPAETFDLCVSPWSAKYDLCIAKITTEPYCAMMLKLLSRGLDCTLMHVLLKASLIELDRGNYFLITAFKVKGPLDTI